MKFSSALILASAATMAAAFPIDTQIPMGTGLSGVETKQADSSNSAIGVEGDCHKEMDDSKAPPPPAADVKDDDSKALKDNKDAQPAPDNEQYKPMTPAQKLSIFFNILKSRERLHSMRNTPMMMPSFFSNQPAPQEEPTPIILTIERTEEIVPTSDEPTLRIEQAEETVTTDEEPTQILIPVMEQPEERLEMFSAPW